MGRKKHGKTRNIELLSRFKDGKRSYARVDQNEVEQTEMIIDITIDRYSTILSHILSFYIQLNMYIFHCIF